MSAALKGCLIHGIGYVIPENDALYDPSTGNRIIHLSASSKQAMAKGSHYSGSGRENIYFDPAVMCDAKELMEFGLIGKPLCVMHDIDQKIGTIVNASVVKNELLITASVTDKAWARKISQDDFDLKSFSVSYDIELDDSQDKVVKKTFTEISVVDEPYYPGCSLKIFASRGETNGSNNVIPIYSQPIKIAAFNKGVYFFKSR